VISDETTLPLEACKIEDVRYTVFRFQVSTDQKVGGSSPSKRTCKSYSIASRLQSLPNSKFVFCVH
jgi:hypothetical protein